MKKEDEQNLPPTTPDKPAAAGRKRGRPPTAVPASAGEVMKEEAPPPATPAKPAATRRKRGRPPTAVSASAGERTEEDALHPATTPAGQAEKGSGGKKTGDSGTRGARRGRAGAAEGVLPSATKDVRPGTEGLVMLSAKVGIDTSFSLLPLPRLLFCLLLLGFAPQKEGQKEG